MRLVKAPLHECKTEMGDWCAKNGKRNIRIWKGGMNRKGFKILIEWNKRWHQSSKLSLLLTLKLWSSFTKVDIQHSKEERKRYDQWAIRKSVESLSRKIKAFVQPRQLRILHEDIQLMTTAVMRKREILLACQEYKTAKSCRETQDIGWYLRKPIPILIIHYPKAHMITHGFLE